MLSLLDFRTRKALFEALCIACSGALRSGSGMRFSGSRFALDKPQTQADRVFAVSCKWPVIRLRKLCAVIAESTAWLTVYKI